MVKLTRIYMKKKENYDIPFPYVKQCSVRLREQRGQNESRVESSSLLSQQKCQLISAVRALCSKYVYAGDVCPGEAVPNQDKAGRDGFPTDPVHARWSRMCDYLPLIKSFDLLLGAIRPRGTGASRPGSKRTA